VSFFARLQSHGDRLDKLAAVGIDRAFDETVNLYQLGTMIKTEAVCDPAYR
jgi:hypothetical protein